MLLTFVLLIFLGLGVIFIWYFIKKRNNINNKGAEKREIKVKFVDDDNWVFCPDTLIYKILDKHYNIQISDTPDYLFFSERPFCSGNSHENFDYHNCVKIFYTEEVLEPDFNLCDYAISCQNINYGDRHFQIKNWIALDTLRNYNKTVERMKNKHIIDKKTFLNTKTDFCSFVYSHGRGDPKREEFFRKLSLEYKKVNSGGHYLNNIGASIGNYLDSNSKYDFEKKHKFSIAFENSSHAGYSTEKIVDAFAAGTIPIYWGDPNISEIFDDRAFINVNNYNSFDEVIDIIKTIDNDDRLYLKMISTPALKDSNYIEKSKVELEKFIIHIIDQRYEEAFRKGNYLWTINYVDRMKKWRYAESH